MKHEYWMRWVMCLAFALAAGRAFAVAGTPVEGLTLEQAWVEAERLHPQLAEARAMVDAVAGRVEQAGALPNPELIIGAQQLPLESGASEQREFVAGLAQPIPLGGRLGKAREAEMFEREVRRRGLEVVSRELRWRVHGAFATALYQQRAYETQREIAVGLEKLVSVASARIAAGDVIPGELARVEMEQLRAGVELKRSLALRDQSMLALATAMGDADLRIAGLSGELDEAFEIPALDALVAKVALQPEVLLSRASLQSSEARIELARAEMVPEVRVEALYHRLENTQEDTIDLGLSIPLPLFNRNQGRLREARAEAEAARARTRLAESEISGRLQAAYSQLTVALSCSQDYRREVLPRAGQVLRLAEARYEAGDISLIELLPVQRDCAMVRQEYMESLRDVLMAWSIVKSFQ